MQLSSLQTLLITTQLRFFLNFPGYFAFKLTIERNSKLRQVTDGLGKCLIFVYNLKDV